MLQPGAASTLLGRRLGVKKDDEGTHGQKRGCLIPLIELLNISLLLTQAPEVQML